MKQKRKVKSLLSLKKDKKEIFIMNLLLILSVSLCIGSALLITTSVGVAADNRTTEIPNSEELLRQMEFSSEDKGYQAIGGQLKQNITEGSNLCPGGTCSYTGLDDNSEAVYKMDFVDPENLERTVNSMYIKNSNFYITSGQVIVNPATLDGNDIDRSVNKVGTGLYSHILGGSDNEVYSNNITLIAGENNKISSGNDNATILGGKDNNFSGGRNHGTPVISLGGENNKVGNNNDGIALIGGKNNEIGNNVSDTFILGGENNKVNDNIKNVIVGGKNVTISGVDNVFVYSTSGSFEPKSDNTFYLNIEQGVGINGTGTAGGMATENAVSIGTINIDENCDVDNLGVVGSYSGCLVGCTTKGKDNGNKWELLDRGTGCAKTCSNSSRCIAGNNITGTIVPANNYNAQCTEGYVDTENAHLCPSVSGYISQYRNVIFETNLVDSDGPCPSEQENLCVYQCDQGFHLTGDVVSNTVKCYRDCEYNWADAGKQILKHNDTVIGYNSGEVACARISSDKTTKTKDYPETCHDNDHEKTLICSNGEVYIATKDNKGNFIPSSTKAFEKGYKYSSCQTKDFQCDSSYNLTKDQITNSFGNGGLSDTVNQWTKNDRYKPINGIRGQYQLCLDYKGNTNGTCETQQTQDPYESHYKLVKCQNGYHTGQGYENVCMKDCTLMNPNGKSQLYRHKETVTGYVATGATCTGTCQAARLVCDDGKWKLNGSETTAYPYNDCTLHPKTCGDQYNVSHADYLEWSGTSIYDYCDSYNPDGKFACVWNNTRYKLIGCKTGFHTEDKKHCEKNRGTADCPDKPNNSHWVRQGGTVTDYPGFNIFGGISLEAGKYLKWWNGAWNATTNGWGTEKYPSNACDRECDGGYHKSGDSCTSNTCTGNKPGDKPEDNVRMGGNRPFGNENKSWKYITGATQALSPCEWACKDGYTRARDENGNRLNKCVEKECGDGLPISMNGVLKGESTYTGADDNRDWTYNSGTLGACQWKCVNSREKSGNGCIRTVHASCGNPAEHFECDGEGTPTNQQTGRDGNTIKGWTWNCMGTPRGSSQECIECNTASGYTLYNGACVKEPVECGGEKPTGYGVRASSDDNIHYHDNGAVLGYTEWTYITDYDIFNNPSAPGCAWSCESGYVVNDDQTGCTIEEKCGTIKRGVADWAGGHYADGRVTSGACIGGSFVGDPFLNRGVIISRSNPNGCGDLYVKRKCSDGGSTRDCSRKANVGILDVSFMRGGGYQNLGELTITQRPFRGCDIGGACMSARSVKVRFTFTDDTSCELYISSEDKESITYHIIPGYQGATAQPDYNKGCDTSHNSSYLKKVEVVGETTYCPTGNVCAYDLGIDTIIPGTYLGGGESCPQNGEAVEIWPTVNH